MKKAKSLRNWGLLTLTLTLGLQLTACKDNELDGGTTNGDTTEQTDQLSQKHDALLSLLSVTASLDSLPTSWNSDNYQVEPTLGVVADASAPYTRLVPTTSAEEADRIFRSMTGQDVNGSAQSAQWQMEGIGNLNFEVNNESNLYATLKLQVKQMPHLQEVRFVPAEAVGNNLAPSDVPFYHIGDVIKQTREGEQPTYYVCVRPCSKAASKQKSHWCSLQLNSPEQTNSNYLSLNDGQLKLPTQLSSSKGDAERMVQNFFNVLRLIAKPEIYTQDNIKGIGDITKQSGELTYREVRDLSYYWDYNNLWYRLQNKDMSENKLRDLVTQDAPALGAFYLGYSSSFFGRSPYTLYDMKLYAKKDGLFDEVKKLTAKVKDTDTYDFKQLENGAADFSLYQDGNSMDNQFIVKHRTGAELQNRTLLSNDKDCGKSFEANADYDIKDIFTREVIDTASAFHHKGQGLFAFGDKVTNSYNFKGNQVCLREASRLYHLKNDLENKMAFFATAKAGTFNTDLSGEAAIPVKMGYEVNDELAKQFMVHLLLAYAYNHNDIEANFQKGMFGFTQFNESGYLEGLSNVYETCKDNPAVNYNHDANSSVYTIKVDFYTGTDCLENFEVKKPTEYTLSFDENTGTWLCSKEKVNKEAFLRIYGYNDRYVYREDYSTYDAKTETRKLNSNRVFRIFCKEVFGTYLSNITTNIK